MMDKDLALRYSHNIIEHLGLKLYQNRPTNVLAELVSNSWDADAANVWIDLDKEHMAIYDDGEGMTRDELSESYLVIGKKKRSDSTLDSLTKKSRKLMGRKGIGKLAPFGIAKRLSLLTISKETSKCYWLEIDLNALLDKSIDINHQNFTYKPDIICDGVLLEDIPTDKCKYGYVNKFLESISEHGTLVILDSLSTKRKISNDRLRQSLGSRFTVTLLRDDFSVFVNDALVTEKQALPEFGFRVPNTGYDIETVNINGKDREIRYWAGFVDQAEWPQDQAGVGVYAHGKIAQDRPFVFGLKGREISTRYMYGVIEADWLDELDEDVISTDRTSINWDNDETEPMYDWGRGIVAKWITEYRKHQKTENEEKVLDKFNTIPDLPKITMEEKGTIKDMVCSMSPKIYKDDALQSEVIEKLTSAWTHRPSRNIIKSLWDKLDKSESDEEKFVDTLRDIHKHLVPESLSLSVTVAQRIYALTKLYELSINGTETKLQALLETFPWILGSDKGKVHPNMTLKENARKAALNGFMPSHGHTKSELTRLADSTDSTTRPDFTIFSSENSEVIIVVELKSPLIPLTYDHMMQLYSYYFWLKNAYPNARIHGCLIGTNSGNLESDNNNIDVITWTEVCARSRKDYLELLAAMLHGVSEHYDDSRIQDVVEFGGQATLELLSRMADADSPLHDLFDQINKKLEK